MKRYLILLCAVSLLLCACRKPQEEPILTNPTEPLGTTEPIPETTQTLPETESTMPPHFDLYHPDYSQEQILEYFEEVILQVEYSDGAGDATLVQKWLEPIAFRIYGTPTEEDRRVLNSFFAQLNQIPGFPGFYTAEAEGLEAVRISFLEPEVFTDSFSATINGEDAFGAVEFWYYTDTNEIYSARIGYRTDLDQNTRNSILPEEIVNMLGISDTVLREDSITYQYSNENLGLSDVDWILLKLLYHPDIQCGMDAQECAAVIRRLYY